RRAPGSPRQWTGLSRRTTSTVLPAARSTASRSARARRAPPLPWQAGSSARPALSSTRSHPMTRGQIFFAVLLLALTACSREESAWTATEAPNRLQVDWRSEGFVASFPAGAAELAPDERAKLARFLDASLRTGDERITLSPPPDADRALAGRR